jgi:replicative DNA helicase
MADLRDSGAIEQDADVVALLYRDDYYNADSNTPGIAELNIVKQRDGATGGVKLRFAPDTVRFWEPEF